MVTYPNGKLRGKLLRGKERVSRSQAVESQHRGLPTSHFLQSWEKKTTVSSSNLIAFSDANLSTGSVNTNEAVQIALCQAGPESPATLSTFHPRFTYPIFGEEERIFGYKGLRIALRFAAHNLWPNVAVSYDAKFDEVADVKAADVRKILRAHLPACEAHFPSLSPLTDLLG